LSPASGASDSAGAGLALRVLPQKEEDMKSKIDGHAKDSISRTSTRHSAKRQQGNKIFQITRRIPLVKGEWIRKKRLYKLEFPSSQSEQSKI
jgi:hypothetical protein